MIIAIDYDNTFSADPALFAIIISQIRARGHQAIIITNRCGVEGDVVKETVSQWTLAFGVEAPVIIYTGAEYKQTAAFKAGYPVDIWIDDCPELIVAPYDQPLQSETAAMDNNLPNKIEELEVVCCDESTYVPAYAKDKPHAYGIYLLDEGGDKSKMKSAEKYYTASNITKGWCEIFDSYTDRVSTVSIYKDAKGFYISKRCYRGNPEDRPNQIRLEEFTK